MPAESTQSVEVRTLLASYSVGLSKQDAARVNFIALLVFLFLLLLGGLVSERSAATRAELFGIGTTLFTYPILQGTQNQPTSLCCLVTQIGLTFVAACQCGGEGRVVPPEIRYRLHRSRDPSRFWCWRSGFCSAFSSADLIRNQPLAAHLVVIGC